MAINETITDDFTGEKIAKPLITVKSIRLELPDGSFEWLTAGDVYTFKDGKNMGAFTDMRLKDVLEQRGIISPIDTTA